jgi:putative DNA primase/helicase
MNAEIIARALGGYRAGADWVARCPAHDDRKPSLSIRDSGSGIVLVRCHAGCEQTRVIEALRSRGLWTGKRPRSVVAPQMAAPGVEGRPDQDDARRKEAALAIWRSATPASGTPVETYLLSRSLHLPASPVLRFYAGLKHPSGGRWPALVALVTRGSDGTSVAIHRTFLAIDGAGKAPVDKPKNDARPLPWRCRTPRGSDRIGHGGRRHRDVSRRNAGNGTSYLGRAFNLRDALTGSAERCG